MIITTNRKARYDYQVIDTWEAGIKLNGLEVKGAKAGKISIVESWIKIHNNQAILIGTTIEAPANTNISGYQSNRDRVLLLHSSEIDKLNESTKKGLTIVPLKVYVNDRKFIKIEIATVKGKKKYDKRNAIKERDFKKYGY